MQNTKRRALHHEGATLLSLPRDQEQTVILNQFYQMSFRRNVSSGAE